MHKDLNTVKGGDKSMSEYWTNNNLTPPVLLANKDNAAVLALTSSSTTPSAAEVHAEKVSGWGTVKATLLGGLLFHHKDDKKGQQNMYTWYFHQKLGYDLAFPGTSSTRYQSNAQASELIVLHWQLFIEFMDFIQDNKVHAGWTNLEKNFAMAIQDVTTCHEFNVLTIWLLCFSCPYMHHVRGHGIDHLDLGKVHHQITSHYCKMIADPNLVLGQDATFKTATFDGQRWEDDLAFIAVQKNIPELLHISGLLVGFLKGCLETWIRFTEEFEEGGIIDGLTAEEHEAAWMPATNDANEGALGMMHVIMRRKPQLTLRQMNAWFMVKMNHTDQWMKCVDLTEEDHAYIRKMQRLMEAKKLENK